MVIKNNSNRKVKQEFMANFPQYRKEFRTKMVTNELNQYDVARAAGVSQPMVCKMLKGKGFSYPVFVHLKKLPINLEV